MKRIAVGIATLFVAGYASANNLSIDNVELVGQNPTQGYVLVEFDLSWDNSWAINVGPKNWDAAWVFVKFRANASEVPDGQLLAYLDWAGLRPMSQYAFEKACRGPGGNPNEFAWGGTTINSTNDYVVSGDGTPSATVNAQAGTGNALHGGVGNLTSGPYRCGIFAASIPNPSRREAGASFYGIMELSGNVYETTFTSINSSSFTHQSGDGEISPNGTHNQAHFPAGRYYMGGSFAVPLGNLRVSNRVSSIPQERGGRGVRSFP